MTRMCWRCGVHTPEVCGECVDEECQRAYKAGTRKGRSEALGKACKR